MNFFIGFYGIRLKSASFFVNLLRSLVVEGTKNLNREITVFMLSLGHFSPNQFGSDSTSHVDCFATAFEITLYTSSRVIGLFQIAYNACQIIKLLVKLLYHHFGIFYFNTRFFLILNVDVFEPDLLVIVHAGRVKPVLPKKPFLGLLLIYFRFYYQSLNVGTQFTAHISGLFSVLQQMAAPFTKPLAWRNLVNELSSGTIAGLMHSDVACVTKYYLVTFRGWQQADIAIELPVLFIVVA